MEQLVDWSRDNNLSLNVNKKKVIIADFRRTHGDQCPLHNNAATLEKREKCLGEHIKEVKKA